MDSGALSQAIMKLKSLDNAATHDLKPAITTAAVCLSEGSDGKNTLDKEDTSKKEECGDEDDHYELSSNQYASGDEKSDENTMEDEEETAEGEIIEDEAASGADEHIDEEPEQNDRGDNQDGSDDDDEEEVNENGEYFCRERMSVRKQRQSRRVIKDEIKVKPHKLALIESYDVPAHSCSSECWSQLLNNKDDLIAARKRWWFQGKKERRAYFDELQSSKTSRNSLVIAGVTCCAKCAVWALCSHRDHLYPKDKNKPSKVRVAINANIKPKLEGISGWLRVWAQKWEHDPQSTGIYVSIPSKSVAYDLYKSDMAERGEQFSQYAWFCQAWRELNFDVKIREFMNHKRCLQCVTDREMAEKKMTVEEARQISKRAADHDKFITVERAGMARRQELGRKFPLEFIHVGNDGAVGPAPYLPKFREKVEKRERGAKPGFSISVGIVENRKVPYQIWIIPENVRKDPDVVIHLIQRMFWRVWILGLCFMKNLIMNLGFSDGRNPRFSTRLCPYPA